MSLESKKEKSKIMVPKNEGNNNGQIFLNLGKHLNLRIQEVVITTQDKSKETQIKVS